MDKKGDEVADTQGDEEEEEDTIYKQNKLTFKKRKHYTDDEESSGDEGMYGGSSRDKEVYRDHFRDTIDKNIQNPLACTERTEFKKIHSKLGKADGAMFGSIDSIILGIQAQLSNLSQTTYGSYVKAGKNVMEQNTRIVTHDTSISTSDSSQLQGQLSVMTNRLGAAEQKIVEWIGQYSGLKQAKENRDEIFANLWEVVDQIADKIKDTNPVDSLYIKDQLGYICPVAPRVLPHMDSINDPEVMDRLMGKSDNTDRFVRGYVKLKERCDKQEKELNKLKAFPAPPVSLDTHKNR